MTSRHPYTQLLPGAVPVALLLVTLNLPRDSDALEFDPGARVSGIYSDNIFLTAENETSDFIFVAAPGIGIYHETPRVEFEVDYLWEWLLYTDLDTTADFHNGVALLNLDIVPDRLALDSFASIFQSGIDPTSPIPRSSIPITANRADVVNLETAPRWTQPIGTTLLDARVAFGTYFYDNSQLLDTQYIETDTTYQGNRDEVGLQWALKHQFIQYEYDLSSDDTTISARNQVAYAELGYGFQQFSVFGAYGRESPFLDIESSSLEQVFWRAGIRRQTARSRFEAYIGERAFGKNWGVSFSQGTQDQSIEISFSQTPSTTEDVLRNGRPRPGRPPADIPAPPEVPGLPPDANVLGDGQRFVRNLLDARYSKRLNRNTFGIRAFWDQREDGVRLDGTPQTTDSRQVGFTFDWNFELGSKTVLRTLAGYRNLEAKFESGEQRRDDNEIDASVSINRTLGRRTQVSAFYTFRNRDDGLAEQSEFTVNTVGINFNREFGNPNDRRRRR